MIGGEVAAVEKAEELLQGCWNKTDDFIECQWTIPYSAIGTSQQASKRSIADNHFNEMQVPVISNTTAEIIPQDQVVGAFDKTSHDTSSFQ